MFDTTNETTAQAERIEIKLVETNFLTRWPCMVCGGWTEKFNVVAEAKVPIGDDTVVRVCERCLEAGDIDERLAKNADELCWWHCRRR